MNDDVKAAVERFHTWEFDGLDARDHAALLAHIDGEPARIAAACEETREAVARHVMGPALKRDPDLFADHLEEVYAATIRRMPLTATPLGDALRLSNETVVKLAQAATEAQARADEGVRYWTDLAQAEARDAAALRARVAELEAAANTAGADASAAALRAMARATNAEAERDGWRKEANRWPELLAQAVAERDEAQRGEQEAWRQTDQMRAERDALRAEHDEAMRLLGAPEGTTRGLVARLATLKDDAEKAEAQVEAARTYARQALDYGEDCDATDLLAAMDEAKP